MIATDELEAMGKRIHAGGHRTEELVAVLKDARALFAEVERLRADLAEAHSKHTRGMVGSVTALRQLITKTDEEIAKDKEIERLRAVASRGAGCLEMNSDKGARQAWARAIRVELGEGEPGCTCGVAEPCKLKGHAW